MLFFIDDMSLSQIVRSGTRRLKGLHQRVIKKKL